MSNSQQLFIEQAIQNYVAPIALDEHNVRIETQEQYQAIDFSTLNRMSFSTNYAGEIPPLPINLALEHLGFYCGISANQLNQLDLQRIKSVYAHIKSLDTSKITIASDTLEELHLSFQDEETSLEIFLQGTTNLKRLVIKGRNTYQIRYSFPITSLEQLTMNGCIYRNYEWLENLPNLTTINISGSVIEDFDKLTFPVSLLNLDLSYSEIYKVTALTKLANLEYLNLFRAKGDIVNRFDEINILRIKRLVITELDRYRDYFRNSIDNNHSYYNINNAVYRAYQYVKDYREKPELIHPYIRKMNANKSDEEIFSDIFLRYLKQYTDSAFYACNPKAFRFEDYSVGIKKWLLSKFEELYPFLDFSDYTSQIATEEKGFLECICGVKADGFSFVNQSGLYRVCYRPKEGKGISIQSLPMHDFVDKNRHHTRLPLNEEVIKKAAQKYIPDYDWNAQSLEIVFLDYYGNIESRKLEIAVLIAIALYQNKLQLSNELVFAGELNNKAEISRWEFISDEFLANGEFSKLILFSTQKKHPMRYESVEVEKFADVPTFIQEILKKQ